MAEEIKITEEEEINENGHSPMLEMARRVLLAGIGAFAIAQDEIEEFVSKLVERGEIAEKDGRRLITELRARRSAKVEKAWSGAGQSFEKRLEKVLNRMNIPGKSDLDELNRKIAELTIRIEELKEAQEKQSANKD